MEFMYLPDGTGSQQTLSGVRYLVSAEVKMHSVLMMTLWYGQQDEATKFLFTCSVS